MTDIKFHVDVAFYEKQTLKQGDIVIFGEKEGFLIARTQTPGGANDGLKFISLSDGNRWNDNDSMDEVVYCLEQSFGKMRIVKRADIHLTF